MIRRLSVSFSLALLGLLALTAPAFAAKGPEADDVMLGTGAVVLGVMALILVLYGAKWLLGLDGGPPPPAPEDDGHAAHH